MELLPLLIAMSAGGAVSLLVFQVYGRSAWQRRFMRARIAGFSNSGLALAAPSSVLRQQRQGRLGFLSALPLSPAANERMSAQLARAGWELRPGEYLGIRLIAAGIGTIAALAILARLGVSHPLLTLAGTLGAALFGWMVPRVLLARSREERLRQIDEQLPDALTSIAKALRTGAGILQAIEYAARETPPPLGPELQGVLRDLELGADAEDVFAAMSRRVGSPDLDIAVTAILIQRTVGGNLSEILMNVTNTIRSRAALHREVHVITTRQRVTSNMVAAMPVLIAAFILSVNQKMAMLLFGTTPGHIALGIGIFFELLGIWLIRRLAKIDV